LLHRAGAAEGLCRRASGLLNELLRLCRVPRHRVGRDQRHPAPGVLPADRVGAGAGAEPSDARGAAVLVAASDPVDLFEIQLGVPAVQLGRRVGGERRRRDVTAVLVLQPLVPQQRRVPRRSGRRDPLDARRQERRARVGVPAVLEIGARESTPCHTEPCRHAPRRWQEGGEEADEEGGEMRRASRYFDSKPNFKLTTLRYRLGLASQTTVPPSTPSPTFFRAPIRFFAVIRFLRHSVSQKNPPCPADLQIKKEPVNGFPKA